jgi:ubiquinone/menaquinone biosynthesis C-methylase UbiE
LRPTKLAAPGLDFETRVYTTSLPTKFSGEADSVLPNPTDRFTGRVESYRRHRPTYPPEVVELLRSECALNPSSAIADIAAGTGILTESLLKEEFTVTAVEPNKEMRTACATLEAQYPKLKSVAGTAEATTLPDHSIDLITVAQAMHWFDLGKARAEFARILRPGGYCAILYNHRRRSGDAFHDGWEELLSNYGVDYREVQRQHVPEEKIAAFFAPSEMKRATFANPQSLTRESLEGRILSSSYMPQAGHPRFEAMRTATERLFSENERNGKVTLQQDCVVCYGHLGSV